MNLSIVEPLFFGAGAVMCAAGFVVYWLTLRAAGAYLGGLAGAGLGLLAAWLLDAPEVAIWLLGFGALLGGVFGIWVVKKLAGASFFLLGALGGLGLGRVAATFFLPEAARQPLFDQDLPFWAFVAGGALGGGALAYWNRNVLMIVLTSAIGALLVNASLQPFPPLWWALALTGLAVMWQVAVLRALRRLFPGRK